MFLSKSHCIINHRMGKGVCFLSLSFAFGLFLGTYTTLKQDSSSVAFTFDIVSGASLAVLVVMSLLPFLFSVLFITFSFPVAIFPISFLKAVSFGFCSGSILNYFGSAGWLIRFFFLFTSSCTLTPLIWFWIRHIDGTTFRLKKDFVFCTVFVFLFSVIDHYFIYPYCLILLMNSKN